MQGDLLRDFRKALRLTQDALAEKLGLSPTFIGMMERGEKAIEKRTEIAVRFLAQQMQIERLINDRELELANFSANQQAAIAIEQEITDLRGLLIEID